VKGSHAMTHLGVCGLPSKRFTKNGSAAGFYKNRTRHN
jgi:hypothetical protein